MSPALTRLMLALRDELSDWAAASERRQRDPRRRVPARRSGLRGACRDGVDAE